MDKHTKAQLLDHLTQLLEQGNAHVTFGQACADVPPHLLNQRASELPYTIWQLAEHVRIAQWDIVEYCLDPQHQSPQWPEGYWPKPDQKGDAQSWNATLAQVKKDRQRLLEVLKQDSSDLLAPLPNGSGHTLLREALLIADHNAYHTGQIILVRRLLKDWE